MWPAPQMSAGSSFLLQFLLTALGSTLEPVGQEEEERQATIKGRHCAKQACYFLLLLTTYLLSFTSSGLDQE